VAGVQKIVHARYRFAHLKHAGICSGTASGRHDSAYHDRLGHECRSDNLECH
jgi:hypothetical protein